MTEPNRSGTELRLPSAVLSMRTARAPEEALRVFPVFSDQDPALWLEGREGAPVESAVRAKALGLFSGARGENYFSIDNNIWLVGLGRADSFHPDSMAAAFSDVGSRLVRLKETPVVVVVGAAVAEALRHFARRTDLPPGGIDTRTAEGSTDDPAESDAAGEPAAPDYVADVSLTALVAQAVACVSIGADPMDLLSEARTKRKVNTGPVYWEVPSLPPAELAAAVERGSHEGRMVNGVRYIASLPGNYFHPAHAEEYTRSIANEFALDIEVFDQQRLEQLGCGGILAVGRGSVIPPRMIRVSYVPVQDQGPGHVVLVGKGITFDTGGISLKPGEAMHEMKYDMCGMALALHAVALAAARSLGVRVSAFLGIAENMPDGSAIKPGDVFTAYNGVTVEIQNTDAEGRLVLGDVLSYAARTAKPAMILDFATLTGACVISLGHEAAGLFTSSDELAARIERAGLESLDRTWRLPHWSAYDAALKSDTADLRNIGGRPAGSITAMRYLAKFVPPHIPWAHLDIAGTAWRDKGRGSQPKGATGWGVRLLNRFFEGLVS